MKPFSESCEQNKLPILAIIRNEFAQCEQVLEIGSGTGQHAVFFAEQLPHLRWQCSDVAAHHAGIQAWLDDSDIDNVLAPLELDVDKNEDVWYTLRYDAVFSANTVHIMSWPQVEKMFAGIGRILTIKGRFCLYGPFNQDGRYTSDSNANFDVWLKQRNPHSAIRDLGDLIELGNKHGLELVHQHPMPANNQILVWHKHEAASV